MLVFFIVHSCGLVVDDARAFLNHLAGAVSTRDVHSVRVCVNVCSFAMFFVIVLLSLILVIFLYIKNVLIIINYLTKSHRILFKPFLIVILLLSILMVMTSPVSPLIFPILLNLHALIKRNVLRLFSVYFAKPLFMIF